MRKEGWNVIIDDFDTMRLSTQAVNGIYNIGEKDTKEDYIFRPVEKEDVRKQDFTCLS